MAGVWRLFLPARFSHWASRQALGSCIATPQPFPHRTMASKTYIIDLTLPLSSHTTPCTIYPGDPPLRITPHATVAKDGYSVHNLHLGTHTGTHIDAPAHFIDGGRTIDQIGLDELCGRALVVDLTRSGEVKIEDRRKVEWDDLEEAWANSSCGKAKDIGSLAAAVDSGVYSMLLVYTGWSTSRYPSLSASPESFDSAMRESSDG